MERPFFCSDCACEHADPADARLGHLVPCIDCSLTSEVIAYQIAVVVRPAIAA
ncbi:MAG: hypothetical protein ABR591_14555 [Candidatus Velthaea sp.]